MQNGFQKEVARWNRGSVYCEALCPEHKFLNSRLYMKIRLLT
jgi:hypothetical protein